MVYPSIIPLDLLSLPGKLNRMRWIFFLNAFMIFCLASAQNRNQELFDFAMNQVNEGQFEMAEQALNKLLLSEPHSCDVLFLKAYCQYKTGRHDASLSILDRLLKLDGNYVNAYLIRARIHRIKGNYWTSMLDYNRARKLDPYQTFFAITRGFLQETQ